MKVTTNNYEGELVIAYNTNNGNDTVRPNTSYVLYIGPKNNGISYLIFKLSTKQILITMKYQTVPVSEDLIEVINKTNSFTNKIQVNHFDSYHFTAQYNRSNNNKDDSQT